MGKNKNDVSYRGLTAVSKAKQMPYKKLDTAVKPRYDAIRRVMPLIIGILGGFGYVPFFAAPVFMGVWLVYTLRRIDAAKGVWGAFKATWWLTALAYLVAFSWILKPFEFTNDPSAVYIAPLALVLFSGLLALFNGIAGGVARLAKPGLPRYFAFAAALAIAEWIRGFVFTGFPWNPISITFSSYATILQSLSIIGTFGLSFVAIIVLASPYFAIEKRPVITKRIGVFLIVLMILGALRIATAPEKSDKEKFVVRIVSLDIPQDRKYDVVENLTALGNLSRSANADLIVWSETAVPGNPITNIDLQNFIASLNNDNSEIAAGFLRESYDGENDSLFNVLGTINKSGANMMYEKMHLVPFGEYMPFKEWLPLKKFTRGFHDFTPGAHRIPLPTKKGRYFLPLICYEAIFPGLHLGGQVDFILNVSNDAWFAPLGRAQHFQLARFRAIEEGAPLVRSANYGISAVVSPVGIVRRAPPAPSGAEFDLPPRMSRTIFAQYGNKPVIIVLLLVFAFCIFVRNKGKK